MYQSLWSALEEFVFSSSPWQTVLPSQSLISRFLGVLRLFLPFFTHSLCFMLLFFFWFMPFSFSISFLRHVVMPTAFKPFGKKQIQFPRTSATSRPTMFSKTCTRFSTVNSSLVPKLKSTENSSTFGATTRLCSRKSPRPISISTTTWLSSVPLLLLKLTKRENWSGFLTRTFSYSGTSLAFNFLSYSIFSRTGDDYFGTILHACDLFNVEKTLRLRNQANW